MSSVTLPDSVSKARSLSEIESAAKYLRGVDAPQAIEPLARLSRRAPGWIVIELSLIARLIVCLIGFALAFGLITAGVWIVVNAVNAFLRTFFPDWQIAWWGVWAALLALWLWRDTALRELLTDRRFRPSAADMTREWVIGLKPFYALAAALRLCAALIFLTLRLALAVTGIVAVAQAWQVFRAGDSGALNHLLTYGFAAGALFLASGLFIFSDWPRMRIEHRSEPARRRLIYLAIATALSVGLGLFVREWSRTERDWIGLSAGALFFVLFAWFLRARSNGKPFDLRWLKPLFAPRLRAEINERQIKFLKWTLFLLGLLGLGLVTLTFAQHWTSISGRMPLPWRDLVRSFYGYTDPSRSAQYAQLEPWLFSLTVGGVIGLLGAFYSNGWAFSLAKPLARPFFWLYGTANTFLVRVRTRLAVRDAIRHHRARNTRLINGHGQQAVCRKHLARFEPRSVRLAYRRKWTYWWCRVCQSDAQAYTGIQTVRGVLNQAFTESEVQQAHVLAVNLLRRLNGGSAPMPLDLDEIEVGAVDDQHDIEMFVTHYQTFPPPVKIPQLKQVRLKIKADANLDTNIERMLKRTLNN